MKKAKSFLIVCSTVIEAKGLADFEVPNDKELIELNSEIDLFISGIGMQRTIFNLTKLLLEKEYKFVLNIGIAGSYSLFFPPGALVNVDKESFADFGVITKHKIYTSFDLGFDDPNKFPFTNGFIINESAIPSAFQSYDKVMGATVNSLLTDAEGNKLRENQFEATVETMEGAGFFYVCSMLKIPFLQFRVISNMVGDRDKSNWEIESSVAKLNAIVRTGLGF